MSASIPDKNVIISDWVLMRCRLALLAVIDERWRQLESEELSDLIHALDEAMPSPAFVFAPSDPQPER